MNRDKLLYELEYEVNKARQRAIDTIKYDVMSVREFLDLGFDYSHIFVKGKRLELGYKWYVVDSATGIEHRGYENNEHELDKNQLACIVRYVGSYVDDDGYTQVDVELVDNRDSKYFMVGEDNESN